MAVPKSAKLLNEEALVDGQDHPVCQLVEPVQNGPIKIKEVQCLNDFVAILLFRIESDIHLPDKQQYRNEGMVVGIGPGLPDGSGGRCATQLQLGDVVLFQDRHVILNIDSDKPPYNGQKVVIVSERSLICKLPKTEFELV